MAKKFKIELNRAGVGELLKGPEMQAYLKEIGSGIVNRCGPGYEMDVHIGPYRANVTVKPGTVRAYIDNNRNNTLLKAVR